MLREVQILGRHTRPDIHYQYFQDYRAAHGALGTLLPEALAEFEEGTEGALTSPCGSDQNYTDIKVFHLGEC